MRGTVLAGLAAAALALVACGGGGGGSVRGPEVVCPLMERLVSAGDAVEQADVADPDAFLAALDDAVLEYTTTLDALREALPDEMSKEVETLRSAVEQYRFQEAIAARAPLDEYARRTCTTAPTS